MKASPGDFLIVERVHLGEPKRIGQIVEVHGPDGSPPYLVHWMDTDGQTLFFPGPDARAVPSDELVAGRRS